MDNISSKDSIGVNDQCCDEVGKEIVLSLENVSIRSEERLILRNATLSVRENQVYGIIGPSGAGKSMLLRSINRIVELYQGITVEGCIQYRGQSIYDKGVQPDALRATVGMLLQQPVIFPKSIYENVLFGVKPLKKYPPKDWPDVVEKALREAALWGEVKDRLKTSALNLSMGQQQRLCLARILAVSPDVILMDEPTSALDPKSSQAIEALILELKKKQTIILVTHDIDQARNVTDWLSCICMRDGTGEIVESACCDALLNNPICQDVVDYLSLPSD